MMTRKRILALLFTAICLLGILPLSVSALTPAIEGAVYNLDDPNLLRDADYTIMRTTPIKARLNSFVCEGSADGVFQTVVIDVFTSEITEIGYINTEDFTGVVMQTSLNGSMYVPEIETFPIPFFDTPFTLLFTETRDMLVMGLYGDGDSLFTFVSSPVSLTITEILDSTDLGILNTTLEAFSVELTTGNYVNWMLDGYNGIIDVFVNNAKVQYVMDNPVFIIALVVFAMAIAFAIATFIFKIFRRY